MMEEPRVNLSPFGKPALFLAGITLASFGALIFAGDG